METAALLDQAQDLLTDGRMAELAELLPRLEKEILPSRFAPSLRRLQYQAAARMRAGKTGAPTGVWMKRIMRMPAYQPDEIGTAEREIAAIFDPLADRPHAGRSSASSDRPYLICMTPRSGSTFLAKCLREANVFGKPDEYLNRHEPTAMRRLVESTGAPTLNDLIHGIAANTHSANGLFGIKADPTMLLPLLVEGTFDRLLAHGRFIYITRRDILMQAISLTRAVMTGAWSSEAKPSHTATFDFAAIHQNVAHLTEMMSRWEMFFALNNIQPLRVRYEEIEQDIDAVIDRVARDLGVVPTASLPRSGIRDTRQRDDLSLAWRDRFLMVFEGKMEAGHGH